MAAIATVPLMLVIDGLSFTDAFFETMSGLTTTGATVLIGLEKLPPSVNLWRHELNWLGGMGIIVLAVAILPLLGVGGMQLYKAETPGPMKDSKLTRAHRRHRQGPLAGLFRHHRRLHPVPEAGRHELARRHLPCLRRALAGRLLHLRRQSVGQFDSPAIEVVLIVFMMIAGDELRHPLRGLARRSLAAYWRDAEAKAFVALIVSSTLHLLRLSLADAAPTRSS